MLWGMVGSATGIITVCSFPFFPTDLPMWVHFTGVGVQDYKTKIMGSNFAYSYSLFHGEHIIQSKATGHHWWILGNHQYMIHSFKKKKSWCKFSKLI